MTSCILFCFVFFPTTYLNISASSLKNSSVQSSLCNMWHLWSIVFTAVKAILQREDRFVPRVLLLWPYFSCPCLFPLFFLSFFWLPVTYFSLSFLSDLADNLVMDDFTFQEQLLTPRLATAGIGSASSPAAQLRRSYLVPTLSAMASVLLFCRHWPESPRYHHSCRSQTIKWLKWKDICSF